MKKSQGIKTFTLMMLIVGSIDSIRNLPTTALFGTTLIFFFIFSAIVFLIPAGLISADLAARWPKRGGIYEWCKKAFGKKTAFFAIWLQWINTLVWYPTILSFIAGTAAYLVNPHLAQNKIYLVCVILTTFWTLTIVNLFGLKTSASFAKICAVVGMLIPMISIIILFFVWLLLGKHVQIHFHAGNILPNFTTTNSWISLTAIMTAFLGMELATVHVNQVHQPQKTFPRALFFSVCLIIVTMVLGSLAIAFVLPKDQINLVDGIMQAFHNYLEVFHLTFIFPALTLMLVLGSLGGMINWMISPAKGLLHAAEDGFLPMFMQKQNKYGVAQNLLLVQAVIVSLSCLAFLLMPSVNGSYWLLTDLSTQLYMLMYLFMFIAAITISFRYPTTQTSFKIPGGKKGMILVGCLGVFGTIITMIVGFFPPGNIDVGTTLHYETMFMGGLFVMITPVLFFFCWRRFKNH